MPSRAARFLLTGIFANTLLFSHGHRHYSWDVTYGQPVDRFWGKLGRSALDQR